MNLSIRFMWGSFFLLNSKHFSSEVPFPFLLLCGHAVTAFVDFLSTKIKSEVKEALLQGTAERLAFKKNGEFFG